MKKSLSLTIALISVLSVIPLNAQKLISNSAVTGVCYAGTRVNRIYIPPPDAFFKKSGKKGNASITIYYTGFSIQAKAAVDYAASILETILPADTRLTILANWQIIPTPGVLGNTSITGYAGGWEINALNPRVFYPVALAEKIAGKSLNTDQEGDLILTINSSVNWYMGTDGQTPKTKYDLVTVVLHEVCHGLGFYDSMHSDGTIGYYGIAANVTGKDSVTMINDTLPMIYDTFVENLPAKRLTDKSSFRNFSPDLKRELTGGQLYFNGPLFSKFTSGSRARLYAPATWDDGSSISHLDENLTLEPNTLMTPFIDLGEAIHNPGNYTFSILADLGWINTRIIHKSLAATEKHLTEIELSATVRSDTLYDRDNVGVVFSFDNFKSSDTIYMTSASSADSFKTIVNIPSYNLDLQYYFFVEDCFSRLYRSPSLIDFLTYHTYVGTDTVKPVITHTPAVYYLKTVDTINFKATATDNLGIDSVYIEYKVNDGNLNYISLKEDKHDNYSAFIQAGPLHLNGGDSISYRIVAVDTALVPNTGVLPRHGYFVTYIEETGTVLESYATDFTNAASDFFNIGFTVMKPAGFSKYGLHSKHPYESPEKNNDSIVYTSILRHPLKLNESGLVFNFNEIVLVEPGDPGSVFGSADFYDYVILDGSRNFGKTWFNLIQGYDSRLYSLWETGYNSSIVGQNSTFAGTESMLKKHTVYYKPSDKISAGDTLLLRFRLYSDPYANGWGWAIEDLKINPLVDAVENHYSDPVNIYPNPGNGQIKINTYKTINDGFRPIRYSIFNSAGICIKNDLIPGDSEALVDISGYPVGFYIIVLYLNNDIRTFKYSLVK